MFIYFNNTAYKSYGHSAERSEQVPFSMAIKNVELMQECFPKHLSMGTARMKQGREAEEKGRKKIVNGKRSTPGKKNDVSTA